MEQPSKRNRILRARATVSDHRQRLSDKARHFKLRVRARRVGVELKNAWPAGLTVLGFAAAFATPFLFDGDRSDLIRYAGMILQLFGVGTVAVGLSGARKLFGRPPVWSRVRDWFRRMHKALGPPETIKMSADMGLGNLGVFDADLVVSPGPDATLAERVKWLQNEHERMRRRVRDLESKLRTKVQEINSQIQAEERQRIKSDAQIQKVLEEFSVGGLLLEGIGLLWLVVGIILATAPVEIDRLLP